MKKILIAVLLMSGCTSLEKQQSNERAQVEIIKVQREALAREKSSQAEAQIALYESLARVAEVDPESADVAVVAMLMVGQGANETSGTGPLVQLREQRNEAVELTKALAPTVGGVLTNVGIAAINANTQRDQIAATRDVQVNQANRTADAIASVATLGAVAANNAGDAITVADNGWLNTGSFADNDTTNTTTTSTTSTTTSTTNSTETNTTDSYNSSEANTSDSNNSTQTTTNNTTNNSTETNTSDSNNSTNTTNTTDSYNTTTDNGVTGNDYSVTYGGETMTLDQLLAYLQSTGRAYSLTIGDDTYESEGNGDDSDPVDIECGLDFGPSACVVDG